LASDVGISTTALFFQEAWIVSKRFVLTGALVLVSGALAPELVVYAQEQQAAAAPSSEVVRWSIITAGFALAFAAGLGALGQGKAVASAAEAIARNPGATGDIRGALLLGLVLIESLVIYVLLISLLLFFFNPFR
jgi:F-type H+-transporting ATPase subunit c